MRTSAFTIALLAAGLAGAPAFAADICSERSHQFGKMRHCVSSVRPAQGGITYGPVFLAGTEDGAWCAGSESTGGAQTVTLHEEPNALIRTINITNGFAKSDETFRQNGRVKRALIETDRGYRGTVTLKDSRASQKIIIAKARIAWVRLTILDTYPGSDNATPCLTEFLVNIEEFANN